MIHRIETTDPMTGHDIDINAASFDISTKE